MGAGADVNARDRDGNTALMLITDVEASEAEKVALVRLLLRSGADVKAHNKHGYTALMYALRYPSVIEVLIEAGADVNARDEDDFTALHLAVHFSDDAERLPLTLAVIQALIDAGADVDARASLARTPLHVAGGSGRRQPWRACCSTPAHRFWQLTSWAIQPAISRARPTTTTLSSFSLGLAGSRASRRTGRRRLASAANARQAHGVEGRIVAISISESVMHQAGVEIRVGQEIQGERGTYEIEEPLGEGGFGLTFRARRKSDGAQAWSSSPGWSEWPIGSRSSCSSARPRCCEALSHPNIPTYVDSFGLGDPELPTGFALVQSFVTGKTLRQIMREGGRLDDGAMFRWFWQLLEICHYLHGQSPPVIHRDISPKNIMIDKGGEAVLIDFGTVQATIASEHSVSSTSAGTFGYAPPEQFVGRATPKSDLYGLAMTFVGRGHRARARRASVHRPAGRCSNRPGQYGRGCQDPARIGRDDRDRSAPAHGRGRRCHGPHRTAPAALRAAPSAASER